MNFINPMNTLKPPPLFWKKLVLTAGCALATITPMGCAGCASTQSRDVPAVVTVAWDAHAHRLGVVLHW